MDIRYNNEHSNQFSRLGTRLWNEILAIDQIFTRAILEKKIQTSVISIWEPEESNKARIGSIYTGNVEVNYEVN